GVAMLGAMGHSSRRAVWPYSEARHEKNFFEDETNARGLLGVFLLQALDQAVDAGDAGDLVELAAVGEYQANAVDRDVVVHPARRRLFHRVINRHRRLACAQEL